MLTDCKKGGAGSAVQSGPGRHAGVARHSSTPEATHTAACQPTSLPASQLTNQLRIYGNRQLTLSPGSAPTATMQPLRSVRLLWDKSRDNKLTAFASTDSYGKAAMAL